ncbi:MAG TPA: glycoside hydrolase family 43 protein [Povalibacter sp.]|nr:glycoside hydrolase family 43 protein [Povalibacter sp.]
MRARFLAMALLPFAASVFAFSVPAQASQPVMQSATNPLILQRADPHVFRHRDGTYYMTATVPEYDRIVLRHSPTIAGLATAKEQVIWRRHEKGEMAAHIWAPEIHFIGGKWYVYFTAGRSDDVWAIRLYVLENAAADPFTDSWTEKGQLRTGFESFSLDATTFEHRGQRYLVWTQRPLEPRDAGTDIYIARMPNPWSIEQPQVSISSPQLDWETRGFKVNEAPAVIVRNGRVFVAFSASATDANYCIGLLTANEDANLLDRKSWTKNPVPVFATSEADHQYGPGHNSFTVAEDGTTDVLVYHARNYRDIKGDPLHDPNRHTRVQRLNWKADGTPDFGEPVADGPVVLAPQ